MKNRWLGPRTIAGRLKSSETGQGIVEYILLIVVVVAIATAVMNTFFKPFNAWAKNYVGDYIYCLLDQGELPGLGGENTVEECEKGFEQFTAAGGRPAKSGSTSQSEDDEGEKGGRSRLASPSSSSSAGGAGGRSGRSRTAGIGSGFDNGESAKTSKTTDVTGSYGRRQNARFSSGSRIGGGSMRAVEYNGITGSMQREQDRIRKREEKVRSIARVSDAASSFVRGGNRAIPMELNSKKASEFNLEAGWSFGESFRILLIIAIIIALIMFVGSQVMQISKSMEKE